MSIQIAYLGAVVGFLVGVLFNAQLFGQTSRAGYHGPNGKFKPKSGALVGKAGSIGFTTLAGFVTGPALYSIVVANPLLGFIGVVGSLYVGLNREVDAWNL